MVNVACRSRIVNLSVINRGLTIRDVQADIKPFTELIINEMKFSTEKFEGEWRAL